MKDKYVLRLYVAGKTAQAERAIADLTRLCERELAGRYRVEVIDVVEDPSAAEQDKIMATPTVVKHLPPPVRRVIGDLSRAGEVLVGLDIVPLESGPQGK
jgi:circadian clock protein KaiB